MPKPKKKPRGDVLIGARVDPAVVRRFDALAALHEKLNEGIVWTRSDVLRRALVLGAEAIQKELDAALEAK